MLYPLCSVRGCSCPTASSQAPLSKYNTFLFCKPFGIFRFAFRLRASPSPKASWGHLWVIRVLPFPGWGDGTWVHEEKHKTAGPVLCPRVMTDSLCLGARQTARRCVGLMNTPSPETSQAFNQDHNPRSNLLMSASLLWYLNKEAFSNHTVLLPFGCRWWTGHERKRFIWRASYHKMEKQTSFVVFRDALPPPFMWD